MSRFALLDWLSFVVVFGVISCSSEVLRRPIGEEYSSAGGAGGSEGDAGQDGGVVLPDARYNFDANCGYHEVDARQEPVKIYFVLDRSGSMSDKVGPITKYASMRSAAVKLFERIGWRSEIGATLFPSKGGAPCSSGSEVFPLQKGDPKIYLDKGIQGPQTQKFAQAIASTPQGGTPTGKTLMDLVPRLQGLGPNTFVLLATDGGPNCNAAITCDASQCMPNIEKVEGCTEQVNCCDPKQNDTYSTINCLDTGTSLAAVAALAQAGVRTIVVGIPGSAEYATVLDLMAVAGGVPREGNPRYYRVDDLAALEAMLLKIGSEITVSCDITLGAPPSNPNEINVFFDQKIIPQDPENGWVWKDSTTIMLRGDACEAISSGSAGIIRVVEGCPTEGLKLSVGCKLSVSTLAGGAGS
ncbi:MAG: vWA domain-containing protein [Myxococcales bacterium]|nr:VWA domain-containing protein [Polyangiaceae bacterium]MDW8248566.1 vWA domain-containing protein [Myxococcales bacterium]